MLSRFFKNIFARSSKFSFEIMASKIGAATLILSMGGVLLFSLPPEERTALLAPFGQSDDVARYAQYADRAENRENAVLLIEALLAEPKRDAGAIYVSLPSGESGKTDNLNKVGDAQPRQNIADKEKKETNEEKRIRERIETFDAELLPVQCKQDYDYCDKNCLRGDDMTSTDKKECRAYCVRQAIKCDIDDCKDQLAKKKRSLFTKGVAFLVVGLAVAFLVPPVGALIFAIGLVMFGLSVAPIFDVINFMQCR